MKINQTLFFFVLIVFVESREINRIIDRSDDKNFMTNMIESRKHKPYHDLFLFMGGLQSLVTFIVIKIKIVLVVVTVVGFVVLALKLFGLLKYTNYPYKNYYPSIGPPPHEFSSYPGPPLSSYSSSHHDHDVYSEDWSPYSDHYAAGSKKFPARLNIREIMRSFVNVDKEGCQAHLMCEFQSIVSKSSFFRYLSRQTAGQNPSDSKNNDEDCTEYAEKCLRSSTSLIRRRKRHETAKINGLLANC